MRTARCLERVRWRGRDFRREHGSIASHEKFIAKYGLPFPLLSDPDHKIAEAYGVWVEKNMYGKKYMGTERTTFVINAEGLIAKVFRRVKPEEHVGLLKEALR